MRKSQTRFGNKLLVDLLWGRFGAGSCLTLANDWHNKVFASGVCKSQSWNASSKEDQNIM